MIPQRILVIEIKTIDNPGLDDSQISTMQFREEHNIYCLAFDRDKVEWKRNRLLRGYSCNTKLCVLVYIAI